MKYGMSNLLDLHIDSMAFRGYGVSRHGGKVIFVPFTVTGDEVQVEIVEERKNYSLARVSRIVKPSPWRVEPRCPYFGRCGGCHWQHINPLFQVEIKGGILKDILGRLGGLKEIPSFSLAPSKHPYEYRVRVQLKVEGKGIGYYQESSHRLIPIDHCPIAHPLVNETLSALRQDFPFLERLNEVEINVSPEEGKSILLLYFPRFLRGAEREARSFLEHHPVVKGMAMATKGRPLRLGDSTLNFTVPFQRYGRQRTLSLRASPETFFQVNLEQNQRLVQTVLEFSDVKGEEKLLDLYSGIGNLTLPLATEAKEILGVEGNKAAVEDARWNARKNGISHCRFVRASVEDMLETFEGSHPDVLVLDPPRTGCKALRTHMDRLNPKRVVYVSCDPTTLARDLRFFSEKEFRLQDIRLLDFFPQSYHMEVVALLRSPCSTDIQ
jgi:23S rRNA (uracil1939-C5)-methyltransferase